MQNGGRIKKYLTDYLIIFAGTLIMTIGISLFLIPVGISLGGLTGIGAMLYHLAGFPVGTVTLLLNIPLIISGFLLLGHSFIIKSMFSVGVFTLFSDIILSNIVLPLDDRMLCALFGGILMGLGLGLIYARGSSTGGIDILNRMLIQKYPHMQIGRLVLITDGIIIIISALALKDITSALYAIVTSFAQSKVIDYVIYGTEKGKMILIITSNSQAVREGITQRLKRGCTILEGKGGFSGDTRDVILCAVRQNEFYRIKSIVKEIDTLAFVIVTDASEVLGLGFERKSNL